MANFLITGLPRSKTAWMSVVASSSVPGAMCWHEPMARLKKWECCFDLWNEAAYSYVGVADAHLGFHLDRIHAEANPRILVIRRDINDVKESLARIGGASSNYCDLLMESIDRFSARSNGGAWVDFSDLKSVTVVRQCLEHLMPGCAIDENRIAQLMDLNIQADMELVWERALESRPYANQILGVGSMPGLTVYQ